jgi:hypothetical protein
MVSVNQKIRRLPGFRFEAIAPAREDVLPRMDVALFVGFASTGPVGIPVAVESAEQFKTIFGEDLPLVWDATKSETVYAFLAPTVRSFFRNGGRRCWILRVARTKAGKKNPLNRASYNFFPLSGLTRIDFDEDGLNELSPAFARARALGSWSDDLMVGTAVLSESIGSATLSGAGEEKSVELEIDANGLISTGDLLRLSFGDEKSVLLVAVDAIKDRGDELTQSPAKKIPDVGKRLVEFTSRRFVWLTELSASIWSPEPVSPPKANEIRVRMWNGQSESKSENTTESFLSEHTAVYELLERENESAPQKVSLKFSALTPSETPRVESAA